MNTDILVIVTILTLIVIAAFEMWQTRDLVRAMRDALTEANRRPETRDWLRDRYDALPDRTRRLVDLLMDVGERAAEATPRPDDDAVIEELRALLDREPSV